MSEQTSNPTSGQNVPKSKFRRKSRQEQTAASKLRMESRGEKLDAAREKLAKQKPPKKPGAVKRLAHTAGHGVHSFVHGKLYEVEHENVGTEGAHRSELAAESVYRFGRHKLRKAIREHPAKAVERAESKHIKATADYHYRKAVEEHPEMQEGGAVSRYLQKQKIKRQYAKQAREAARQTAKAPRVRHPSRASWRKRCLPTSRNTPAGCSCCWRRFFCWWCCNRVCPRW